MQQPHLSLLVYSPSPHSFYLYRPMWCDPGNTVKTSCLRPVSGSSVSDWLLSPLAFSLVHRPGSAEGKQPKGCAYELPVDHIPAACVVIPPFALSPGYQAPGRGKQSADHFK